MSLSPDAWNALFKRAARVEMLVVGDLILDEYLWGSVERISPEAPVPILLARQENFLPGGAANVAANLANLGCQVSIAGVVGNDARGERLGALLAERGVRLAGVVRDGSRITTLKTRVMAAHQQMLRIDREEVRPVEGSQAEELLTRLQDLVGRCDGVICSDYGKGLFTPGLLTRLLDLARRSARPVLIDPKGNDYRRYRGATIITPNKREAHLATGLPTQSEAELAACARRLFEVVACAAVLITRGEEGMSLYTAEGGVTHIPTAAQQVFDVTGAGDTVISTLALAAAAGASLEDAARLANLAAGIVVSKLGTASVSLDELRLRLRSEGQGPPRKIVSLPDLEQVLGQSRATGKRIAFTNGCFDILHAGHIKYLEAARRCGDLLIVGVNDDASVCRLKGPQRPLLSVAERTEVLAGLHCVDYIVVFAEDTPLRLIETLRPDVLVKGADYRLEEVVGREAVERHGGRVELVPLVPEQSTTKIVNTILGKYRADAVAAPTPGSEES